MTERQEDIRDALRRMYGLDFTHLGPIETSEMGLAIEIFAIHCHPYAILAFGCSFEVVGEVRYFSWLHWPPSDWEFFPKSMTS